MHNTTNQAVIQVPHINRPQKQDQKVDIHHWVLETHRQVQTLSPLINNTDLVERTPHIDPL